MTPTDNVQSRLNFYFAAVTCLSGMTLFGNPELKIWPWVCMIFAIFGFVFVDWLRWFALPPVMAYLALGAIAVYTLSRFATIGEFSPEPQMIAVAELLVLVQVVLMMQEKNRRIYEQLAVFSLLLLIVAAIFNDAVIYGLLLVPLSVIFIGALSLLHVYITSEDAFSNHHDADSLIQVQANASRQSFVQAARTLPRLGLMIIGPAVVAVAAVFFYALPRTNQDARKGLGGAAQTGFDSTVRLGQIGNMLSNPQIAARIKLRNRFSGKNYDSIASLYLRGTVLESYDAVNQAGTWATVDFGRAISPQQLPPPPLRRSANDRLFGDDVIAEISLSPMRSDALFSLPPYFSQASGPDIVHVRDRWMIERRKSPIGFRSSQITYRFATLAFRGERQNRFLPRASENELSMLGQLTAQVEAAKDNDSDSSSVPTASSSNETMQSAALAQALLLDRQVATVDYQRACLQYDVDLVPSAERLANQIVANMSDNRKNPYIVASAMESYLSAGSDFSYTLDLSMQELPGMDPIEQFLAIDRKGSCQYFASALVLMLRSQGIPARMVVGFSTDEYNNMGGYYIARQLHAHAWVEALIDAENVPASEQFFSRQQPPQYWMRLDPTPGGGGTDLFAGGSVANVLDLAQDIWTNYVVDADANDRRRELAGGDTNMSGSYQLFYEWVKLKISRVRAGELGAGSLALANRDSFSWPTAVLSGLAALGCIVAYRLAMRGWILRWSKRKDDGSKLAIPSVGFFAETVALLERLGVKRRAGQTAKEYTEGAARSLHDASAASLVVPLETLTNAFYVQRFAEPSQHGDAAALDNRNRSVEQALERLRSRAGE